MRQFLCYALWVATGSVTLLAASLPLGIEAQLIVSLVALAAMSLIRVFRLKGVFRTVFLGLGTFVMMRYLFWRFSSTMPSMSSPADLAAGVVLLGAECYCAVMLFLSLFTVVDPLNRPSAPSLDLKDMPSVDILVPSYNESIEILATTLAAAKRVVYPTDKLNVFLLDDGGTDEKINSSDPAKAATARARRASLQALCGQLGVTYLTRKLNSHAKAGNLNNGLMQSCGELVAVFDADHAPSRDFLIQTVGFFGDKKLFLVQTPHFFLNTDPIAKNLKLWHMPAENEMFYSVVQKGLDKWNSAFFCGSAAVLRREALAEVGGFHGSSITEDAETALELHSRGWKSAYVDRPMIAGLQPETFESFIMQRSRWCRGMVQILMLKNPLFKRGLSLAQRLCYLSSTMFWLFPLPRMIFIFTPMFFIFFGMKIYVANQQEFLAYTAGHLVAAAFIQSYVFGRVRWPWTSDIYEYIQSVQLFRALLSVIVNPRRPKFDVTAKGQTLDEARLSSIALPYFVIFGIVATSMVVLLRRYMVEVESRDLLTVIGIWTLLNLGMSGIALGAVSERRERRGLPRIESALAATLIIDRRAHPVVVADMSFGGLRVTPTSPLPSDLANGAAMLRLPVPGTAGDVWETPVVISESGMVAGVRGVGLRFTGVDVDRYRIVAQVMFANVFHSYQERNRSSRAIGICEASARLVAVSVLQTGRGIYFALFRRQATAVAAENEALGKSLQVFPLTPEALPERLSA